MRCGRPRPPDFESPAVGALKRSAPCLTCALGFPVALDSLLVLKAPARPGRSLSLCGYEPAAGLLMRINIWIVLAVLLALLAITRFERYQSDTQRICANDP